MSQKPIFVATHPRACSTAFERVFMTRRDTLQTFHEPFGDAFYYGPERMGERFESDEKARDASGFSRSTFKTILDDIERGGDEGKRAFVKDMIYYMVPPGMQKTAHIAPSLQKLKRGVGTTAGSPPVSEADEGEPVRDDRDSGIELNDSDSTAKSPPYPYDTECEGQNPSVFPREILERFHFTFLIRHPRHAIPSYFRCCVPPLVEKTGFYEFMPCEAGYSELRRFFDYCKETGMIGPKVCGQEGEGNGLDSANQPEICVVDADDLLDDPEGILRQYCSSVGLEFSDSMLNWNEKDQEFARIQFEKWNGFHEDAIHSKDLKPRQHKKVKSDEELYEEWTKKYGKDGADVIRDTVKANVADYEYLKQFAIRL